MTSQTGAPLVSYVKSVANAVSPWWFTLMPQPDSAGFHHNAVKFDGVAVGVPLSVMSSMRKLLMLVESLVTRKRRRTAWPLKSERSKTWLCTQLVVGVRLE